MNPQVIDLISDSESDSVSVNGSSISNVNSDRDGATEIVQPKAEELREMLKSKGWAEMDANNIKDGIYRLYGCNGEVWTYKSKRAGSDATGNSIMCKEM